MDTKATTQIETQRVKSVQPEDEIEYYEKKYEEARTNLLKHPDSKEALSSLIDANKALFETYDKYRIGKRLMIEFHIARTLLGSQNLQAL